jgi:hypothetical protein
MTSDLNNKCCGFGIIYPAPDPTLKLKTKIIGFLVLKEVTFNVQEFNHTDVYNWLKKDIEIGLKRTDPDPTRKKIRIHNTG